MHQREDFKMIRQVNWTIVFGMFVVGTVVLSAESNAQSKRTKKETELPVDRPVAKRLLDQPYVENGKRRQQLDLYYVEEFGSAKKGNTESRPKLRPLVIWIHGGAWKAGDKRRCPALFLLDAGFAVASLNYRYSQQAPFPAQIHDCKQAIVWLRKNAKRYHIDPNRFGVWGASAGGHLAALVGTSGGEKALRPNKAKGEESDRVQAVVDWFGPTDLLKMNLHAGDLGTLDHDAIDSPESQLLGGQLQTLVEKAKTANPLTYISKDDPPFLIMHGGKDRLVSVKQSQVLHQLLKRQNVDSKLVIFPEAGHGGFDPNQYRPQIRSFFQKHLMIPSKGE